MTRQGKGKSKWRIALFFSFLSMLFPQHASAFFSPSTLALVTNAMGSFLPMITWIVATIVVYGLLFFIKLAKNRKRIFMIITGGIFLFSLLSIFLVVTSRYAVLKEVNQFDSGMNFSKSSQWASFLDKLNLQQNTWRDEFYYIGQGLRTSLVESVVDLQEVLEDDTYKLLGVNCSRLTLPNTIRGCDLGIEILIYPDNEERIVQLMRENNISKDDKLLVYCESGYRSSLVALVLDYYGYNVKYAALNNMKDLESIDFGFDGNESERKIFVDILDPKKDEYYTYFILNENDANEDFFQVNWEDYTDLKHFMILKGVEEVGGKYTGEVFNYPQRLKNVTINKDDNTWSYYETEAFSLEDLINSKIVCLDKLHCFTTKYYLEYLNVPYVEKIYCLKCNEV